MNAWDISFSSLSVGYGDHAVLHDINATLPGGKVSVILGGSGCGKSTLLRHIIGLSRPIGGSLRIGGQDLFSLPHAEARRIRRRMGVLFQDGALLGALTLVQSRAARPAHGGPGRFCRLFPQPAFGRHAQAGGPCPGPHRRTAHPAV